MNSKVVGIDGIDFQKLMRLPIRISLLNAAVRGYEEAERMEQTNTVE